MNSLPLGFAFRLFRDGRYAGALLGSKLRDGESEFVPIAAPFGESEAKEAAARAADKLEKRLNISHLHLPRHFEGDENTRAAWWKY
jgi:hypothetical protein